MANHEFTGVFIPAHIWLSKELEPAEKMLLGEVEALSKKTGWCSAGRKHFAEWLNCKEPNISYFTKKLERLGFLEIQRSEKGEGNKMRVIPSRFYTDEGVNGIYGGGKRDLPVNTIEIQSLNSTEKEEKAAAPFPLPENENQTLKAEKETPPPNSAQSPPLMPPFTLTGETIEPQPAKVVRLYTPELPSATIVDSVPAIYETAKNPRELPPEHLQRVDIGAEIERLKTDAAAKETFALVRKIPSTLYADYVEAFGKEIGGTGETYSKPLAFRKHFFNWCSTKWEIEQRKTQKQTGKNGSHITHAGGDLSKYNGKQIF